LGRGRGAGQLRSARRFVIGRNFGNGHINAYDPKTGEFIDKVRDPRGQAIVIDGLWSLRGGNGGKTDSVYFTAGPNGERDGLFGAITPNP
jgi:uncharacterized protein (TIGR03118 family)